MSTLNQLQLIGQLYSNDLDEDESDDNSLKDQINLNGEIDLKTSDLVKSNYQVNKEIESNFIIDKLDELDKCCICSISLFKYKCPSCLMKTCSLDCFKRHKIQNDNCTGLRESLRFKRISNFDDNQLNVDFKFLDNYNREIDGIKRQKRNIVQSLNELPNWLKKLKYEANRRSINLKLLPAGFKRRLENKTTFMYSSKEIHWDIDIIFTDLNLKDNNSINDLSKNNKEQYKLINKFNSNQLTNKPNKITFHIQRVSENQKLKDLLIHYLKPSNLIDNLHLNNLLKYYQDAKEDELSVLIKLSFNHYMELDQKMSINNCLKNKTIIEYPTILIILKKNLINYNLIKDDELKTKIRQYSDKSYNLLLKNNLIRTNFRNTRNNQIINEEDNNSNKISETVEELNELEDGELSDINDKDDEFDLENELSSEEDESDGPLEVKTKFTFDNESFNNL